MYLFVTFLNILIEDISGAGLSMFCLQKNMTLKLVIASQAEQDIASREKSAEQLQDDLAAQDESIAKLSKEKKALEEAKQVRHSVITSVSFYADKNKISKSRKNKSMKVLMKKRRKILKRL